MKNLNKIKQTGCVKDGDIHQISDNISFFVKKVQEMGMCNCKLSMQKDSDEIPLFQIELFRKLCYQLYKQAYQIL